MVRLNKINAYISLTPYLIMHYSLKSTPLFFFLGSFFINSCYNKHTYFVKQ